MRFFFQGTPQAYSFVLHTGYCLTWFGRTLNQYSARFADLPEVTSGIRARIFHLTSLLHLICLLANRGPSVRVVGVHSWVTRGLFRKGWLQVVGECSLKEHRFAAKSKAQLGQDPPQTRLPLIIVTMNEIKGPQSLYHGMPLLRWCHLDKSQECCNRHDWTSKYSESQAKLKDRLKTLNVNWQGLSRKSKSWRNTMTFRFQLVRCLDSRYKQRFWWLRTDLSMLSSTPLSSVRTK